MAEEVALDLKVNTGASARNMKELKDQIELMRKELEGKEFGSKEFNKLAGQVQNAESKFKTLNKTIEGLEPQQKAEAFLKMGEGIAGGFVAAQGAMALIGAESEELGKIQAKVQGAIAIAMGVRMISEAALQARVAARIVQEKLGVLLTTTATTATTAQTVATNVQTAATGKATIATRLWNVVLNANPIVRMAAIIMGVVGAIAIFIKSTDDGTEAVRKQNEELERQRKLLEQGAGYMSKQHALKQQIRDAELEEMKLEGKSIEEINARRKDFLKEREIELNTDLELIEQKIDKNTELLANTETTAQRRKELSDEIMELELQRDQIEKVEYLKLDNEKRQIDKDYSDFQNQEKQKRLDKQKEQRQKELDAQKKLNEEKEQLERDNQTAFFEMMQELDALQEKERQERDAKEIADTQARHDKIADIDQKARTAKMERMFAEDQMNKQIAEDKLKREQDIHAALEGLAVNLSGTITALGEAFARDEKQLEKFRKAAALVQIGIDTAKAISAAVAAAQANPANAPTFGAAGAIQLASSLLTIATNVAKAKQILSSGGSVPSAPSASGGIAPVPSAPVIQLPGQRTLLDDAERRRQNQENPNTIIKTYVVSSEMTGAQRNESTLHRRAVK